MGVLDEIFGALVNGGIIESVEQRAKVSKTLDMERVTEAHALLRETAERALALPVRANECGMFPRVKVMEHSDLKIMRNALEDHVKETKEDFHSCISRYALGEEEVTMEELRGIADYHVDSVRLLNALDTEHARMHRDKAAQQAAEQRAAAAYMAMDERSGD